MNDLVFDSVSLSVQRNGRLHNILSRASAAVPRGYVALVAESRLETVALLDLLCRRINPQSGRLQIAGRTSWPIGHSGPFSSVVTGNQAVSHFAVLYGFDRRTALDFMRAEFSGVDLLHTPIQNWPPSLKSQFMLLMALIPQFDLYLVDANLIIPDEPEFSKRFLQLFLARTQNRTVLITVRQSRLIQSLCSQALYVAGGQLELMEDVSLAIARNNQKSLEPSVAVEIEDAVDDGFMF